MTYHFLECVSNSTTIIRQAQRLIHNQHIKRDLTQPWLSNITSSLSLYWLERELMLGLKCFSKRKETLRALSNMNCWRNAESGVHRKHMGMGSQAGFHLPFRFHHPLLSTLQADYRKPNFPSEDSFKPLVPIVYKCGQRYIKPMKEN